MKHKNLLVFVPAFVYSIHMKVFICDISKVSDASLDKAVVFLSASEKERLSNMISVKRQREFIAGHYLLRRLLSRYYNKPIEQIEIQTLQSGALKPADAELGFVSLSHSFDYVAIALCEFPVGLDMEKMRSKDNFNEILEQIDSVKPARDLIKQGYSAEESFFRLWTKREALYKLNSVFAVSDKTEVFSYFHKNADFMLCVASPEAQSVVWENLLFEKC